MDPIRAAHRDEEGKKAVQKLPIPKTRHPETVRHFEQKLADKGLHRLERHPADGLGGLRKPPPKSGHGGKFTWEGPEADLKNELEPPPPAIDERDPNYVGEQQEQEEEEKERIVGTVEAAKAAEVREGVARVDFAPEILEKDVKLGLGDGGNE